MWLCMTESFLSIVDKGDPSRQTLLVRARYPGDIERVFPEAEVVEGAGTDYRFRARIDRGVVALRMAEAIRDINYPNFKSAVPDRARHDTYAACWRHLLSWQDKSN